jgi:hypothetical protein
MLRDLIRKILVPVEKRLTLDQILEHPWVRVPIPKIPRIPVDINRMK